MCHMALLGLKRVNRLYLTFVLFCKVFYPIKTLLFLPCLHCAGVLDSYVKSCI